MATGLASFAGMTALEVVTRGDVALPCTDGSVSGSGGGLLRGVGAPIRLRKEATVRHGVRLQDGRVSSPLSAGANVSGVGTVVVAQSSHGSAIAERPVQRSPSTNMGPATSSRPKREFLTVSDAMTGGKIVSVKAGTTIDEALQFLVDHRISGMPVVNDDGQLIGVVSDYDLLALDSIVGSKPGDHNIFPAAGSTWKAFKEIQKLLHKMRGKTVGEVMTPHPLVVRSMTNLEDAVRLLLESKFKRLPVVDDNGKLV
ncbi:hypothetical protein CBR_g20008 [Chara braunii]|uniref:CBS domain-containing protein n=1 Tax=Chara braunii TaxID=69332 RepID=A0A388KZD4_CHABU|nr:hypothetical protein CBR_g20008 [Chara braunii]|eukprot:GBG75378.1 hypothetical protein CBR_g20008 [Chara braunii]